MEVRMEKISGILKIHGVLDGEIMDISRCKEVQICVQLLNVMLILLLIV